MYLPLLIIIRYIKKMTVHRNVMTLAHIYDYVSLFFWRGHFFSCQHHYVFSLVHKIGVTLPESLMTMPKKICLCHFSKRLCHVFNVHASFFYVLVISKIDNIVNKSAKSFFSSGLRHIFGWTEPKCFDFATKMMTTPP